MATKFGRAGVLIISLALAAATATSQTTWQTTGGPAVWPAMYCYDSIRDRTVLFTGSATWEYDGTSNSWQGVAGSPIWGTFFGGVAYDRTRQRVVCHDGGNTWHWDGISWTVAASNPPSWSFRHLVAHAGRGTVIAFGGPDPHTSNDLYEWNGATWNLLATTNKPPRPWMGFFGTWVDYLSAAYDARRDKLVLFGSGVWSYNTNQYSNIQPTLWEWDATTGWVSRTVTGIAAESGNALFFDSQRGVLTVWTQSVNSRQVAEWDGGVSWQVVTPVNAPPLAFYFTNRMTYDEVRGQAYTTFIDLNGNDVTYAYKTVSPARFETLGAGCPGSAGAPTLRLTHNWTRAWLGRALSVDLINLPLSAGFVAVGWSNQQAGGFTLPLSLAPFGMPGCFARVGTDAVFPVTGTGGQATLSMQVPVNNSLVGAVLYQQGVSLDPGFNAAGLTVSNSARITIGRL